VSINNNNNVEITEETQPEPEQDQCVACFESFLDPDEIEALEDEMGRSIEQFCAIADSGGIVDESIFRTALSDKGVDPFNIDSLILC
jgi:hypothetical protein